mgnify:CR=1 FL=1
MPDKSGGRTLETAVHPTERRARIAGRETALVLAVLAALLTALLLLQPGAGEESNPPGSALPAAPVPIAAGAEAISDDSLEAPDSSSRMPAVWNQPRASASGNAFWGPDVVGPFQQIWEIRTGYELFGAPVLIEETLYFGCNDSYFRAVSAESGAAIWAFPVQCGISGEAAVDSSRVYFGGQDGYLYCLDRSSGSQQWKAGLGYHILSGVAIVADTLVVAGNSRGGVAAVSTRSGEVAWSDDLQGLVLGPAAADSLLVLTTESGAVAAYSHDGARIWHRDLGRQCSAPSISDGRVFVGLSSGILRCLSLTDGSDVWSADLQAAGRRAVLCRPVVADELVIVGTSHSRLACVSASDGSISWTVEMENWVQVPPAVGDSTLYVSCDDKRLHVLSLPDGSPLDSLELGSYSGTAPTVADGVVYLGTAGGKMAAYRGTVPGTEAPQDATPAPGADSDAGGALR